MDFLAYLRHEKIYVDDPYEQEGLREKQRVPVGKIPAVFENFYQVRGNRIYCHVCGGHRHYKGITGVLEDGTRILFGRKCASDYFGPEVARLHAIELRRRTNDAYARYKILAIQSEIQKIAEWLDSYRPLIAHCSQGWIDIKTKHPDAFKIITDHLRRNNGRYIRRIILEIGNIEGKSERVFQDEILGSVSSSEAIPSITQLSQSLV